MGKLKQPWFSFHDCESFGKDKSTEKQTGPLKVITWNVLFDIEALNGMKDSTQRFENLCNALENMAADVICLQEVTPSFMKVLYSKQWVKERYYASATEEDVTPYGQLILSRWWFEVITYKFGGNKAHKKAVIAKMDGLSVLTLHLPSRSAGTMRASQLKNIVEMVGTYNCKVIAGDFNFECEDEASIVPKNWVDSCLSTMNKEPILTFDPSRNDILIKFHPNEKGGRYDRIYLRGLKPKSADVNNKLVWCSDHFPLIVEVNELDPSFQL